MSTHAVIDLIHHAPGLHELVLERNGMEFVPGDCVAISDATGESRPYSLASGTDEPVLRVLYRPLTDGKLTGYMDGLQAGHGVMVSEPFGWFHPGEDAPDSPAIFIATGTGIAPFLSVLRSRAHVPPRQLLWGVRHWREAPFASELGELAPLTLAVSRERASGCHHGRVTDLLGDLDLTGDPHIYLCGLDAMIESASAWLAARGVSALRIHREVFFHAAAPSI